MKNNRYPGQQESNIIAVTDKKSLKTKLYIHSTIGDVALRTISRETNDLIHDFVQSKFFAFPQPRVYVLNMFLNFGQFSTSRLSKNVIFNIYKKKRVYI